METIINNKTLKMFQENQSNYNDLKSDLIRQAKVVLGDDFLTNYYLPKNFNLYSLNDEHFRSRTSQELSMPFCNDIFSRFLKMKKYAINDVYMFNQKSKNIHGVYLIGKENGKNVLFCLTIVKNIAEDDFLDFTIKLDVCIKGKQWLNVIRLDSFGPSHPNYIINGKVVDMEEEVTFAKTPHLHRNSEEVQVIANKNLDYSPAMELNNINFLNKSSEDSSIFKSCFNMFLNYSNIDFIINKKIDKDYKYSFKNVLFDYNKIKYVNYPEEIKEM